MMIPDSKSRMEVAMEELDGLVAEFEGDSSVGADLLSEARNLVSAFNGNA